MRRLTAVAEEEPKTSYLSGCGAYDFQHHLKLEVLPAPFGPKNP